MLKDSVMPVQVVVVHCTLYTKNKQAFSLIVAFLNQDYYLFLR